MKFYCSACDQFRHVEEDHDDPRKDHCWKCGELVPYTDEEIARWRRESDDYPKLKLWPGLKGP